MKSQIVSNTFISLLIITLLPMNAVVLSKVQAPPSQSISVMQAVPPRYPLVAAAANVSGTVTVEVQVSARGDVMSSRAIDGNKFLRTSAENAARRWLFAPIDERANVRVACLTFVFTIMPRDTLPDELLPIFIPPYQIEIRQTLPESFTTSDPPGYEKQPHRPKKKRSN